jgi:DNA processing protein
LCAINKGEIFRFVAKPWLREELTATVRNAYHRYELLTRNHQLSEETAHLNDRLKGANTALEQKVRDLETQTTALNAANQRLAESIMQKGGAIISEWQRGDGKTIGKWSFLERNRLVSGLADAVIITEAAARSGTLNTAAHALSQGRELFVVPGNITSPLSEGCNSLLKQGAHPVTSARDILEIIAPTTVTSSKNQQTILPVGATPGETAILKLLIAGIRDGDQLQQQSGLSAAEYATTLTMLEINGIIKPLGANRWTIA